MHTQLCIFVYTKPGGIGDALLQTCALLFAQVTSVYPNVLSLKRLSLSLCWVRCFCVISLGERGTFATISEYVGLSRQSVGSPGPASGTTILPNNQ